MHFDKLFAQISQKPPASVCVAAASDENVLSAVSQAHSNGIAEFILIDCENRIRTCAQEMGIDIAPFTILNEPEAAKACALAVQTVADGKAAALMKGHVDTSVIMSAVLDKNAG